MRFIDFYVYYITSIYKNKTDRSSYFSNSNIRSMFLTGLTLGLLSLIVIEFLYFLILKQNLLVMRYSQIVVIAYLVLLSYVFEYVYIKRKRLELIHSPSYKAFTLSRGLGIFVCVGTAALCSILFIVSMIVVDDLLGV